VAAEPRSDRLVDRLQQLVDRLNTIEVAHTSKADMKSAIDELRREVDNVKLMAPHVYAPASMR
jgi:hypothetical protein